MNITAPIGTVGGDIVGRQIVEAQRPVTEELARLAAQIAREKGVEIAPLRAILEKLGEAGISDNEIPCPPRCRC